ncbi:sporulation protein YpjB [Scopulibacillus darangshiensis]|uniref:Sporulation protein YpjB n=1 Tax=Scopulibacillus darangshiensis TaxID=442528 RepID=A0A4R2PBD8_9BACL|nr:sporulation protein YpjB [Scopulibacillus darangshiensis]TCP31624.1 sporulation protein YpjB [Scopulibacillus darangshiensis]
MKAFFTCLLILIVLFAPVHAFAKDNSSDKAWEQLTDLSDQIFQYVDSKHYSEATAVLKQFNNKWHNISLTVLNVSDLENRIIQSSIIDVNKTINSVSSDKSKRQTAIEFRLAVDAATHNQQPLWMGLKPKLIKPIDDMKEAVKKGDDQTFQHGLNEFLSVYQMIYPSLVIDLSSKQLHDVNSAVNQLTDHRITILQSEKGESQIKALQQQIKALFGIAKMSQVNEQSLWTVGLIGGVIVFTLIYVSWRKYRGQGRYRESKV